MNLFNKLPGYQRSPAGVERQILRLTPRIWLYGTLALASISGLARLMGNGALSLSTELSRLDIYVISLVVLYWTVVLTLAIGAFIVMVMKGPAYVADGYALQETEQPVQASQRPSE